MVFQLFRLPIVVLTIVMNQFHLNHLVFFSLCSQRTRNLGKSLLRKSKSKTYIEAHLHKLARIELRDIDDIWSLDELTSSQVQKSSIEVEHVSKLGQEYELVKIEGHLVPITKKMNENGEATFELYFEESFEGIQLLLDYCTWLFNSPIGASCLNSRMAPDQSSRFLNYAMTRQNSIGHLYIECDMASDEEIRKILIFCNFANEFFLQVKPSDDHFQHQFSFEGRMITLMNAFWIDLENVFNINCQYMFLEGTRLTNDKMNQFLKRCQANGFSDLKLCDVEMEDIDLNVLLDGLNAENFPEGEERKFIDQNGQEESIYYGFDIQTNDGKTATIVHEGGDLITNSFYMVVW